MEPSNKSLSINHLEVARVVALGLARLLYRPLCKLTDG